MALVPQQFDAVNVFKFAKEGNGALTCIRAPPEGWSITSSDGQRGG